MTPGMAAHAFPSGGWIDDFKVCEVENGYLVTILKKVDIDVAPGMDSWMQDLADQASTMQDASADPVMAKIRSQSGESSSPQITVPSLPKQKVFKELRYIYPTVEDVANALCEFFREKREIKH